MTVVVEAVWLALADVASAAVTWARGPVVISDVEAAVYVVAEFSTGVELPVGVLVREELVVIGKLEVMFCST